MKRRYMVVLMMVVATILATGASVMAEPADPAQPGRGPAVHLGVAWGAVVDGQAAVHNFVRPAPQEPPIFTLLSGTGVRLTAGASGVWLGEPGGTLSVDLEAFAVDDQGNRTLLGEDHVSDTREGPALRRHELKTPLVFDRPGEVHLLVSLTATAETETGATAQDVDEFEATVIVVDPSTFGSISGQVTAGDTGEGLEGLPVTAVNRELRIHRPARTNAHGEYTIQRLPPGDYIVRVEPRGTPYVGEFYQDARSPDEATPVTVTESADTPDISFSLERGAEISGLVTDETTGEPLAGIPIVVRAVRPEDETGAIEAPRPRPARSPAGQLTPFNAPGHPRPRPEPRPDDGRPHRPRPAAVTAEDGAYVVPGLRDGEYIVAAVGVPRGYSVEFWQEAPTSGEATPVSVALGDSVPEINFTLESLFH